KGDFMKLRITLILIIGSVFINANRAREEIKQELLKIKKTEDKNLEKIVNRKEKLVNNIDILKTSYDKRDEKVEKLKEDSQVRWYRDEYKKVLRKYEKVQREEKEILDQKKEELKGIDQGLSIISKEEKK